jgi:hypothetical protein
MIRLSAGTTSSALLMGATLSGCGLEAFFHEAGSPPHEKIVSTVSGTLANDAPTVTFVQADGSTLPPLESSVGGGEYELVFENTGELSNGLLEANEGAKQLKGWLPLLGVDDAIVGFDLDGASTAKVLLMQGAMSAQDKTRQTVESSVAATALEDIDEAAQDSQSPEAMFIQMVTEVIDLADAGDSSSTPLVAPVLTSSTVVTSALDPTWWAANEGSASFTQEDFDGALLSAASSLNVIGCIDERPDGDIRVVFEVDLNDGRLDGACRPITGFGGKGFVSPDEGDSMFFVGGVHEDSPIQDQDLNIEMGAWDPNLVPMFDDGTNGDEVAGDNIWTKTFVMPRNARVSYKYTWGTPGEGWNDTEEWPGNERWLEIVDVNGDNFIRRRDSFADESSNKNVRNECCGLPFVTLTWDPLVDTNDDGFYNTREEPFRTPEAGDDCTADTLVTPRGVSPVLVECPEQ